MHGVSNRSTMTECVADMPSDHSGNSWLAISQVNFTARSSHPALKALAPWEAYTDPYRDFVGRGGRAHIPGFHKMIEGGFAGQNPVTYGSRLTTADRVMLDRS